MLARPKLEISLIFYKDTLQCLKIRLDAFFSKVQVQSWSQVVVSLA